jgi:putative transposase
VQSLAGERPTYGYRRVTAMLNRQPLPRVNHKRVYRVMRREKLLLERSTGRPHRVHDGVIVTLKSDLRWCSAAFEVWCWNRERVRVALSLDCCDRAVLGHVATRSFITGEMIRDLMVQSITARFEPEARMVPQIPSSGSQTTGRCTPPPTPSISRGALASSCARRPRTAPNPTAWPSRS